VFLRPVFLKFGFLYSIVYIVAGQLNANLIAMFQWPQLITALIGGFIFLNLLKNILKQKIKKLSKILAFE